MIGILMKNLWKASLVFKNIFTMDIFILKEKKLKESDWYSKRNFWKKEADISMIT